MENTFRSKSAHGAVTRFRTLMVAAITGALMICASCTGDNGSPQPTPSPTPLAGNPLPPVLPTLTPKEAVNPGFKPCNDYFPLIPGSMAKYTVRYPTGIFADVSTVVDQVSEGGNTYLEERKNMVDTGGGVHKTETGAIRYACDGDKVRLISEQEDNFVDGNRTKTALAYIQPAYAMIEPSSIERTGSTWSYSVSLTAAPQGDIAATTQSFKASLKVLGREDVTVPAGTFKNAIKISKQIGKANVTEYYAAGVGLVKRDDGEGTTWQLNAYSGLAPLP